MHTAASIWIKWTLYCATGELMGIGVAGGIAFILNQFWGEPHTLSEKFVVLTCMLFAGAIEGLLLGACQWQALKDKFPKLPRNEWIAVTVAIAVIGWLLGMLPSLFFLKDQTQNANDNNEVNFDNPFVFALLSIGVGIVMGAMFGFFQWLSLRKYAFKAYRWITANALGWGVGIGWIYLFASLPSSGLSLLQNIVYGITGGLLAGLSVGAVTGLFLIRMNIRQHSAV